MRVHGCERPFTVYAIGAWLGQILCLAWFAIVAFGFLSGGSGSNERVDAVIITGSVWGALLALGLSFWSWCQLADPSNVSPNALTCIKITKEHDSHYCAVCKKAVPGIDHHCLWLNTCVGSRTYASFYFLALSGALLYSFQIIILALLVSVWKSGGVEDRAAIVFGAEGADAGLYAVSAVGMALSLPAAAFYSALFAFHTYLIFYRKITTYEYFIDKNTRERKKRQAKAVAKSSS